MWKKAFNSSLGAAPSKQIYRLFTQLQKGRTADFQSPDTKQYRFEDLQATFSGLLQRIDSIKPAVPPPKRLSLIHEHLPAYVQQSLAIESQSPFGIHDTVLVNEELLSLMNYGLDTLRPSQLRVARLPDLSNLLPDDMKSIESKCQLNELRNHIIASHWITSNAIGCVSGTSGCYPLTEAILQSLAALLLRGTMTEELFRKKDYYGGDIPLGAYRRTPIPNRTTNPRHKLNNHSEIEDSMRKYFEWMWFPSYIHPTIFDVESNQLRKMHPLIKACQATVYLNRIRPFRQGNDPVSRLVMQDLLLRSGYIPVALPSVIEKGTGEYVPMIKNATEGNPEEFVEATLQVQLDALREGYEEYLDDIVLP